MGQTIRYQSAAGDTDAYLADRLASDGFTVLTPDLFDGTGLAAYARTVTFLPANLA